MGFEVELWRWPGTRKLGDGENIWILRGLSLSFYRECWNLIQSSKLEKIITERLNIKGRLENGE